jgi:3-oxoacyl-(acyl-carrier-protein) synthase
MNKMPPRRVVITGLGVVAPNGVGQEAFWQAISTGQSGITPLDFEESSKPIQVAGIVRNFVETEHLERKLIQRTDRMTHFALAALQEALFDAQIELAQEDPQRVGAVIANTMGGVNYVLQQLQNLYTRGPRFMSAYTAIAWLHVSNIGQTAIRYGIQGYCKTPVNDTTGGLDALGIAYTAIQRGSADVLLTGGCEAFLHPFILMILSKQGQYITENDVHAYRPFDRRASGLILAEGAGICVVEEYEHAKRRNAPIYGEIVGYGQTNDAHGLVAPSSDGTRYAKAICQALQQGDISVQDVTYMSLDGRALPQSDRGEADALRLAFGTHLLEIPTSVPRTMFGHSYAAAGAIDAITALLALKYGLIPPTINCEELDPAYQMQLVRDTSRQISKTRQSSQVALVAGRGTGGVNSVLALKKVE